MTVSCFMYKQQRGLFLARLQLQQSPQRGCCSLVSAGFGALKCHLQVTGAGFPRGCPDPCVIRGSALPPGLAAPSVSPQVWLCHHAQVAQQGDSSEAVGAALDQELPVWGAVEENAPQLLLSPSRGAEGAKSCSGVPS